MLAIQGGESREQARSHNSGSRPPAKCFAFGQTPGFGGGRFFALMKIKAAIFEVSSPDRSRVPIGTGPSSRSSAGRM